MKVKIIALLAVLCVVIVAVVLLTTLEPGILTTEKQMIDSGVIKFYPDSSDKSQGSIEGNLAQVGSDNIILEVGKLKVKLYFTNDSGILLVHSTNHAPFINSLVSSKGMTKFNATEYLARQEPYPVDLILEPDTNTIQFAEKIDNINRLKKEIGDKVGVVVKLSNDKVIAKVAYVYHND